MGTTCYKSETQTEENGTEDRQFKIVMPSPHRDNEKTTRLAARTVMKRPAALRKRKENADTLQVERATHSRPHHDCICVNSVVDLQPRSIGGGNQFPPSAVAVNWNEISKPAQQSCATRSIREKSNATTRKASKNGRNPEANRCSKCLVNFTTSLPPPIERSSFVVSRQGEDTKRMKEKGRNIIQNRNLVSKAKQKSIMDMMRRSFSPDLTESLNHGGRKRMLRQIIEMKSFCEKERGSKLSPKKDRNAELEALVLNIKESFAKPDSTADLQHGSDSYIA